MPSGDQILIVRVYHIILRNLKMVSVEAFPFWEGMRHPVHSHYFGFLRDWLPMSSLYVILLVVIAVTLMGVSLFRASLVKTKADYLVAGRSLPAIVLVFTLLSSWIGAGSLFAGIPGIM